MGEHPNTIAADLAVLVRKGDSRSIARVISAVENREAISTTLLHDLFPHTGRALLVGVTGAAGAGKSTLVDGLALRLRKLGKKVGILAVDPSSPFSGGAFLGDRVRMRSAAGDPEVFIRSLATRGALGGLSAAALDAAMVLDAAGKDVVLLETVGVGQDEVAVARIADVSVLLLVPQMGDEVQTFKAGVMEIANVFIINKADLPGADQIESDIRTLLDVAPTPGWRPDIVKTIASRGEGIEKALESIFRYLDHSQSTGMFAQVRIGVWRQRILEQIRERVLQRVGLDPARDGILDQWAAAVAARDRNAYSAADEILQQREV
ncbi:MAG: methylmalonyl Co-A mutase-associated GTPase MeaB [Acidobacteria bacterium]|nr:methylmalonyl Co-A mutase-associated GTPase MeaB [Acidobacteriota bacterium]